MRQRKLAAVWVGMFFFLGGLAITGGPVWSAAAQDCSQTVNWAWMKGASTTGQAGTYGALGTQAVANTPGARFGTVSWTDPSGNLWLFGGYDWSVYFNDLWKYDLATGNWTWMKGTSTTDQKGTYGALGTPASANKPGARYGGVTWTDSSGKLWLFGGSGYAASGSSGSLNDLWKYDPATGNWTWMKGASTTSQLGTYGTQGTPAVANTPGAHAGAVSWTDSSGVLWLFGGYGYGGTGSSGYLNDLWKYNPATGKWTWMKGSSTKNQVGTYGTLGTPAPANSPGARKPAVSWADSSGKFWLFGGYGKSSSGEGELNDLWRYDPTTGNWTWMKGASTTNQLGTYGTLGTPAAANTPGAREVSVSWTDFAGALWLFGGLGIIAGGGGRDFNDLWKYDVATGNWTWMKGAPTPTQFGTYGTLGTPAAANTPGAREYAVSWTDPLGKLWLFGGTGYATVDSQALLNDLWRATIINTDPTPPVITLLGDSPATVECHTSYTDAGATASDNCAGDLTGSIVVSNPVNVNVPGAYTVRYNVEDPSNNRAVEVARTVNVVDTTPPVITLLGSNPLAVEYRSPYTGADAAASDTCAGDLSDNIVTMNPVNVNVLGAYTVRYNVSDGNGNNAVEVTRTVNVADTISPAISLLGANPATAECHTSYTDAGAIATDDGGADLTGSIVVTNPVDVNAPGIYTVRYNVSDAGGNRAPEATRTVNVVDTTAPVITLRGANPATVECHTSYTDSGATASDSCAGDRTGSIIVTNPVNANTPGTYTVTYNVNDGHGNSAVQVTRTVTVADTTPPVITLLGNATVQVKSGATYSDAGAMATDACAGNLTASIVTVNPVSTSSLGTYTVTYNVNDGNGNSATQMTRAVLVRQDVYCRVNAQNGGGPWDGATWATGFQDIQSGVNAANTAGGGEVWVKSGTYAATTDPVVTMQPGAAIYGGFAGTESGRSQRQWWTNVTTIDGQDARRCLIGADNAVLDGFTVTNGSGPEDYGGGGMYILNTSPTISNCKFVDNHAGSRSYPFPNYGSVGGDGGAIKNINGSPTVTNCIFTGNTTACTYASHFAPGNGGSIYSSGGMPVITNCTFTGNSGCYGASIAGGSGILKNCILWSNVSSIDGSEVAGFTCTSSVIGVNPLFMSAPGDLRLRSGSPCIDTGTASGAPLTDIEGRTRPDGAGVDMGAYEADVTPPVITACAANQIVSADGTCHAAVPDFTAGVTGTDNFGATPTVTQSPTAGTSVGLGTTTVTLTTTDASGNTATCTATLTVADTTAPVISLNGFAFVTVQCGGTYTDAGATATDNCAGNLTGSIAVVNTVNTTAPGAYTVRYNVNDGNGNNADEVTRTVNVVDSTLPMVTLSGANPATVECHTSYTDAGATAGDACAGDLAGSITAISTVNTSVPGVYAVTYNVGDGSGNSATATRTVNVVDTTPPVIRLNGAAGLNVECGASYTDAGATAGDACAGDLTGSITSAGTVNTSVPGAYTVTYNTGDGSGNSATATRTVTVADTVKPVITACAPGRTSRVEPSSTVLVPDFRADVKASDNSGGPLTVTQSPLPGTPVPAGKYAVTLTVTDWSGNAATCGTTLMVIPGNVYLVDPTSPGPEDGLTWPTAFHTLQSAIDAAHAAGGGQVWVAGGSATAP